VGFGWNVPVPYIQRQCDKGIPRYVDADNQIDDDRDGEVDEYDERDVFINEMKEELVPQASGYFFCENEGAFIRYARTNDYWVGTLPTGVRMEFGVSASARIREPASGRVYRWCLERLIDTHGNTIVYRYQSFPGTSNWNQIYCSSIAYGPGAPPWQNFHFAVFGYEDRPDWFEDGRPGFILRTGKRLKEIVIGTQGPALAGHLAGDFDADGTTDHLVRKYRLDYLRYAGTNSHWSLLARVQQVGADGTSTLPPATFGYAVCDPPDLLSATGREIGGANEPPFVMDNELADLVDLNGDGLPDILKTEAGGGAHTGYLNLGEAMTNGARAIRWGQPNEVASADGLAWNVNLQSASDVAHLADMDGDGIADLAYKSSIGDVSYFANGAKMSWGQRRAMSLQDSVPPAPFGDPDVRTADIDFDKRMDVVQSIPVGDGVEYRIWFNLGQQRYARSLTVSQTSGFLLSQPGVHLVDFNGDRVPDVVRVRAADVTVTAGLGHGQFAEPIVVPIPDPGLEDTQVAVVKLQDITGDGLADLVLERAEPGQLWYWLNLGNYTFSPRKIIAGMPAATGAQPAIRWADLNGNGTTDLIYADSQSSPRLVTVDLGELLGCVPGHNVLTNIANGIGRVTTLEYQPSTRFALDDAAAGQPWPDVMPFPVPVVSAVITSDSLGHDYVTRYRYHDGYYDGAEKEFRGFARVDQIEIGDTNAPTLVTRSHFNTGRDFEAMKGRLLTITTEEEDGDMFWHEVTLWTTPPKVLRSGNNGQRVQYAHPTGRIRTITERGRGTPRILESAYDYDDYGNQTLNADYGVVIAGDRLAFDDERITATQYAVNLADWIVRLPSRREIKDGRGVVVSRTESFYDDETFSGNNLGQVLIGNLTLTRAWIDPANPAAFVPASRSKYDAFGNPVLLLDPLAALSGGVPDSVMGHYREITYDDRFQNYPVQETVHVGADSPALVARAAHDPGFGTLTRLVTFNGHETACAYDALARLIRIVKPGDTPAFPSLECDYVLAQPFGAAGLINYVEKRLLDKPVGTAGDKRAHYFISRQFVDGLGRLAMTKHEAEAEPQTGLPRVVVKAAVQFNSRRVVARTLNPFYTLLPGNQLDALLAYENVSAPGWEGSFHENGQLVQLDLASAHGSVTEYDATLRSIQVTNPDATMRQKIYEPLLVFDYDEHDTDPNSPFFATPTVYQTDGLGRHVRTDEVTRLNDGGTVAGEPGIWSTRYQYDVNDRLVHITDSQNNAKLLRYDGLLRLIFVNDPDRGVMTYSYDPASNLIESTDARNQRITYTYDGVNRLRTEDYHDEDQPSSRHYAFNPAQSITHSNRPDVAYFYDQPVADLDQGDGLTATAANTRGFLAYVWDLSGEEHTSYDARGRVESVVKRVRDSIHQQLVSYRTGFAYDAMDRLTQVTYPDNDHVGYQYNERELLESITCYRFNWRHKICRTGVIAGWGGLPDWHLILRPDCRSAVIAL
jgi:YD repeat-containing protein